MRDNCRGCPEKMYVNETLVRLILTMTGSPSLILKSLIDFEGIVIARLLPVLITFLNLTI